MQYSHVFQNFLQCHYVSTIVSYPRSPSDIVKAVVKASVDNYPNVSVWATSLKTRRVAMSRKEKPTLKDCIEDFRDTRGQIHQYLGELKHLGGTHISRFIWVMETKEDSCLDCFHAGDPLVDFLLFSLSYVFSWWTSLKKMMNSTINIYCCWFVEYAT